MALNFPNNPSLNETYTGSNGLIYVWDGTKWITRGSDNATGGKVDEAPQDGTVYGRVDANWQDISTTHLPLTGGALTGPLNSTTITADTFVGVGVSPTGSITMFAGTVVPTGWLECNGQTAPSALATVLGQANVPDLRGEFIRGWDNGAGVDTGRALLSTQGDDFASHNHDRGDIRTGGVPNNPGAYISSGNNVIFYTNGGTGYTTDGAGTDPTGGSETRPRNVALMYIIKT